LESTIFFQNGLSFDVNIHSLYGNRCIISYSFDN
jgi:hypothetical protein